jgi:hypothetical protein
MSGYLDSTIPEFDLQVSKGESEEVVTVRLERSAVRCYELFCNTELLSEWLYVVGTVVVHRRDEKDRALEVDFMGSLERASIAYTLLYEYRDDLLEVSWRQRGGSVKQLSGSARFLPEGESACTLRYTLAIELPQHLPPWSDELYRARPAETVVLDFCEWLHMRKD